VIVETNMGALVLELYWDHAPKTCRNFHELAKKGYYNGVLFHRIVKDFVIQGGDPTGTGRGGESIYGLLHGLEAKYFEDEIHPQIKHKAKGVVAMANQGKNLNGSQFYITTGQNLDHLDGKHTIFGFVESGLDVLDQINNTFTDKDGRPLQNIRIKHTVILDDPFPDPPGLEVPPSSPALVENDVRPEVDEKFDEDEGKTQEEIEEERAKREAKSHSTLLEIIEDLPDADIKPPENVLFVCKLNPVTLEEDLELIFSRFGEILSCEIIKDCKTGDSLGYAFIEFSTAKECESAYMKMDNVLIDDRRIHVDFSQSVAKSGGKYSGAFKNFARRAYDPRETKGRFDDERKSTKKAKVGHKK